MQPKSTLQNWVASRRVANGGYLNSDPTLTVHAAVVTEALARDKKKYVTVLSQKP